MNDSLTRDFLSRRLPAIRQVAPWKTSPAPLKLGIATACALALSACSTMQLPGGLTGSTDRAQPDNEFPRRMYAGIGMGTSRLEPAMSADSSWTVNDKADTAGQVTVGVDVSKTFSVELHSADLGSAGFAPEGQISYQMNGASAIIYAGANRRDRDGINTFGRVGVGAMENSAEGDINYTQVNGTQVLMGAGAEYGWKNGIGVRGEVIVFDKDARFAQLGVVYRLGGENKLSRLAEAPTGAIKEIFAASRAIADKDNDNVADQLDQCPDTAVGIAVDNTGCDLFNGIINGVNFESSSAQLTLTAQSLLDNVAEKLTQHPDVMVAIRAHADSTADDNYNMELSRQRAISVAKYLITRGVPKTLMSARAFGERLPVADNNTIEGKAQNRRVELVANRSPVVQ